MDASAAIAFAAGSGYWPAANTPLQPRYAVAYARLIDIGAWQMPK